MKRGRGIGLRIAADFRYTCSPMRLIPPAYRLLPFLITGIAASSASIADDPAKPGPASSVKEVDEPFDAFADATRRENEAATRADPRLTLITEFIEISQTNWSRLSRDPDIGTNDPALRKHISEMMKSGEAALVDMNVVAGMSGDPLLSRSFRFHIYPIDFEPPQIDEKNGRVVPAAFDAQECWSAGCVVNGSATIAADGRVGLQLSPEIVEQSGETITGKDESEVRQPKFSIRKIYSDLVVTAGEPALAGVMRSLKPPYPDSSEAVLLVFVRADIHVPAIPVKK